MSSRNLKILWIAHFLPWPPHGGSAQRSYNLMLELAKEFDLYTIGFMQRPHQPDAATQAEAKEALGRICEYVSAFRIPSDWSRIRWGSLLAANVFSREPYSAWRFRSRPFRKELETLAAREHFDIIYADTVATAQEALRIAGDARLVLNHHNVESSLLERRAAKAPTPAHRWYLSHQAKKLRAWEQKMCPRFDLNQAVSTQDAEQLRSTAPSTRYEVVPNGTDVEYFTPTSTAPKGHEMVFVGGGTWMPNRDAMSWFVDNIFPLIARQTPDVVMHVVGSNPPPDVVRASDKDPRIRVHGFVPDIRPYLARSAVYVVPIRVGGGTRLKILDAFAAGKAVVSTTIGAEGIDCVDGVHLRQADTPAAFASSVVELFSDPETRRSLEVNGRRLAEERYAWPVIGSRLRSLYRELVS